MNKRYKIRIATITAILLALSLAIALILYALRQNIDLYYTPTQLLAHPVSSVQSIKLGGMVKKGSFHRKKNSLSVSFVLTDYKNEQPVSYKGVLPALFREGQGIIVQGHLDNHGIFFGSEVLAKHDEKYRPPDVPK